MYCLWQPDFPILSVPLNYHVCSYITWRLKWWHHLWDFFSYYFYLVFCDHSEHRWPTCYNIPERLTTQVTYSQYWKWMQCTRPAADSSHYAFYRPFYSLHHDYVMVLAEGKTKENWWKTLSLQWTCLFNRRHRIIDICVAISVTVSHPYGLCRKILLFYKKLAHETWDLRLETFKHRKP